jgi:methionine-rich copper-binding protein CopC
VGYKKDTKNENDMKTRQSKQDRQSRQEKLMIAVAVIAGVYFVVWTLIGLIS